MEPIIPAPIQIDDIVEIVKSYPQSFSGSDFFNVILDSHSSLLTIGWYCLSLFTLLWKVFCNDKKDKESAEYLQNPNGKVEVNLRNVNQLNIFKYKYEGYLLAFLERLPLYLKPERQ